MSNEFETFPKNEYLKRVLEIQAVSNVPLLIFVNADMLVKTQRLVEFWKEQFGALKINVVLKCGCGWLYNRTHECTCEVKDIQRVYRHVKQLVYGSAYQLYCVDVELPVDPEYVINSARYSEKFSDVENRVKEARKFREQTKFSMLSMSSDAEELLMSAVKCFNMNDIQVESIVSVASDVAALNGSKEISCTSIAEAIQYVSNVMRMVMHV